MVPPARVDRGPPAFPERYARATPCPRAPVHGPMQPGGSPEPDGCEHAPTDHPAGRHHRRAVRALPGPRRAGARHGHAGDAGRRRHDLRGRGRLHPAPVHDDRHPRRRRRGRDRRSSSPSSRRKDVADTDVFGLDLGWRTGLAFLVGAACSMASGIIGMYISVQSNVRTAAAARRSLVEAVQVAMRGGAVSGFLVVALSLLGVYGIFAAVRRPVRRPGDPRRAVPHRRLRLRRLVRGALRPARRRHLHEGRRRRLGPRRQGREGHPRGRPAQRGRHRRPRRRQRRRLRRPRRRPVRVHRRREHRRDDPRRRRLRDRRRRPAGRTRRPGSSSRSSSAPSGSCRRSSRSSSSAAARTRTR